VLLATAYEEADHASFHEGTDSSPYENRVKSQHQETYDS
jgi:hypothetical protein